MTEHWDTLHAKLKGCIADPERYRSLDEDLIGTWATLYEGCKAIALNIGNAVEQANELHERVGYEFIDLLRNMPIRDIQSIWDRLTDEHIDRMSDAVAATVPWLQSEGCSDRALEFLLKLECPFPGDFISYIFEAGRDPMEYLAGLTKSEMEELHDRMGKFYEDDTNRIPLKVPPEHIRDFLAFDRLTADLLVRRSVDFSLCRPYMEVIGATPLPEVTEVDLQVEMNGPSLRKSSDMDVILREICKRKKASKDEVLAFQALRQHLSIEESFRAIDNATPEQVKFYCHARELDRARLNIKVKDLVASLNELEALCSDGERVDEFLYLIGHKTHFPRDTLTRKLSLHGSSAAVYFLPNTGLPLTEESIDTLDAIEDLDEKWRLFNKEQMPGFEEHCMDYLKLPMERYMMAVTLEMLFHKGGLPAVAWKVVNHREIWKNFASHGTDGIRGAAEIADGLELDYFKQLSWDEIQIAYRAHEAAFGGTRDTEGQEEFWKGLKGCKQSGYDVTRWAQHIIDYVQRGDGAIGGAQYRVGVEHV